MQLRLDEPTARELLAEHLPVARALARSYPWVELDDLLQEARVAIVDAYCRYDASRGASLKTWIQGQVRWAVRRIAASSYDPELRRAERTGTDPQLLNGADPEQQFWRASALGLIAQLSPRQATILTARCHGAGLVDVATQLGISYQRVQQEEARALQSLDVLSNAQHTCECGALVLREGAGEQLKFTHQHPACKAFSTRAHAPSQLLRWLTRYGSPAT